MNSGSVSCLRLLWASPELSPTFALANISEVVEEPSLFGFGQGVHSACLIAHVCTTPSVVACNSLRCILNLASTQLLTTQVAEGHRTPCVSCGDVVAKLRFRLRSCAHRPNSIPLPAHGSTDRKYKKLAVSGVEIVQRQRAAYSGWMSLHALINVVPMQIE
ncbi:hypothetical protein B0H14DRAFT_2595383 [Mycena olivaceomarginata]|nr:hypothetical protein B0H14DRAFT_2595383 [Mycena olivaceomarginata]